MNYDHLYECILDVYKIYEISAFPVNYFEIIRQHGFKIVKYSDLGHAKKEACLKLSEDACIVENTLFYESNAHPRRISFSIAHELGHEFLNTDDEDEADEFASHFLAPRILIHKYNCRNADQIHDAFGLSYAASNRALASYREWYRNVSYRTPRQPSKPELQLEKIFFPEKNEIICQPDDDPEDPEFDMVDKYNYILRVLKAGLDVPAEFKKDVQRYRRMGLI